MNINKILQELNDLIELANNNANNLEKATERNSFNDGYNLGESFGKLKGLQIAKLTIEEHINGQA